jgi:hypothetical protein
MSLHDFRRAAATFLAMDAPEKIGLIPGMLQHVKSEVSEQHYNLARSMQAGRRFAAHLAEARDRFRPIATKARMRRALPDIHIALGRNEDRTATDGSARDDALRAGGTTHQRRERGEL